MIQFLCKINKKSTPALDGNGVLLAKKDSIMSNITISDLYSKITERFSDNQPFTTLAAGLQGFQFLGMVEDWFISLEMNRHKVIHLTATNRQLGIQLDKLMVATRPAPGEYHFSLDRADFDKWTEALTPPQKKATIWELFTDLIEAQDVSVAPGGKQELWQSGSASISILRETKRDELRLVCKNGKLTVSQPLARWGRDHTSNNGNCRGVWKLISTASANYASFIAEARS